MVRLFQFESGVMRELEADLIADTPLIHTDEIKRLLGTSNIQTYELEKDLRLYIPYRTESLKKPFAYTADNEIVIYDKALFVWYDTNFKMNRIDFKTGQYLEVTLFIMNLMYMEGSQ